jgi:hypothetical protein
MVGKNALLQGRDYYVLIEHQPVDRKEVKRCLLFNKELMHILATWFIAKGKTVHYINASERYQFLGIHNWRSLERHKRKDAVVKAVTGLLGHLQAQDRGQWESKVSRRDLANSLSQCLARSFRSLQDVATGTRLLPGAHAAPQAAALLNLATPNPPKCKRERPSSKESLTKEEVEAKLQALLTCLKMRGHVAGADHKRMQEAHKRDPNCKHIAHIKFMKALDTFNKKGVMLNGTLAARLAALSS